MPRYEIVAHVTREFDCETAEEAAALVRRQLQPGDDAAKSLLHLAVWREDPAFSPLSPSVRQQLLDFFSALERCAGEAEKAFRGRVEAILMAAPTMRNDDVRSRGEPEKPGSRS
ncbi:MAG: hypothetical protein IT338_13850 [Thermomicrobiales bacterium]|nr:hypothetical protein [Thermomicrobiales bacterium]